MAVLPGVLGCRLLRRTIQVLLGTNTLRLPGGTPIFMVSRQQFMKYPGYSDFNFKMQVNLIILKLWYLQGPSDCFETLPLTPAVKYSI